MQEEINAGLKWLDQRSRELFGKVFEKPVANKLNLFTNREFLRLAADEWKSSISKTAMVRRVQKFIRSALR